MLIRLGNNQVSLLKGLLFDYLEENKKKEKDNKVIRREYAILKNIYNCLSRRKRLCPKCGQRIK